MCDEIKSSKEEDDQEKQKEEQAPDERRKESTSPWETLRKPEKLKRAGWLSGME